MQPTKRKSKEASKQGETKKKKQRAARRYAGVHRQSPTKEVLTITSYYRTYVVQKLHGKTIEKKCAEQAQAHQG